MEYNPDKNLSSGSHCKEIKAEIGNSLYFFIAFLNMKGYLLPMVSILLSKTVFLKLDILGLN
jgi:hypothetical protein